MFIFQTKKATVHFLRTFSKSTNAQYALKLSSLKAGTGGRASFNGIIATVFGSSGFIGRSLVARLCKHGTQVVLPYRGEESDMREYRVMGELGQVVLCPFFAKDENSIKNAIRHSNVVINLIGRDWETRNFKFNDVHVDVARSIANACAQHGGINKFVHFSAMNASPNPPSFYTGGSKFLRSKHLGELAVMDAFPAAIIIRPSDVYGFEDHYFGYYNHIFRRNVFHSNLPLYARGKKSFKMPVWVSDVVSAVMNLISNPEAVTGIYELYGPHMYSLYDLMKYMNSLTRKRHARITYMSPWTLAKMYLTSWFPNNRTWNLDRLEREFVNDVPTGALTFSDVNIEPKDVTDLWHCLARDHLRNVLAQTLESVPHPPPPVPVKFDYLSNSIVSA